MSVIADVFEVVLQDTVTGDVIGTTTLQDGNIDVSVQEQDVRGGRGNQLLGILHSDRDISIALNDINFRYDWMAKQFGQDITTGAGVAYATPKTYLTTDGGTSNPIITLDETPTATNNELTVYNADGQKVTGFTITTNEVDFASATPTVAIGDELDVRTYKYDTDAQTQEFVIDNSVFAKGVQAILTTVEVDEAEERITHTIQYQFYNALPSGNFTINTAAERNAQAQAFNLRVVKPTNSTEVGKVLRIPVSAA